MLPLMDWLGTETPSKEQEKKKKMMMYDISKGRERMEKYLKR